MHTILVPSQKWYIFKDTIRDDNYRLISFINIDGKILSKILVNGSQEHIKAIICHDQVDCIPEMQSLFNISNQLM